MGTPNAARGKWNGAASDTADAELLRLLDLAYQSVGAFQIWPKVKLWWFLRKFSKKLKRLGFGKFRGWGESIQVVDPNEITEMRSTPMANGTFVADRTHEEISTWVGRNCRGGA